METKKWRIFIVVKMLDRILHGSKIVTAYAVNQTIVILGEQPDTGHPGYLGHATAKDMMPIVKIDLHILLISTVSKAIKNKDLPENPPEMKGPEKS